MTAIQDMAPTNGLKRTVFLFGASPWNQGVALRQCAEAGLRVVVAKTISDESESNLGAIHRGVQRLPSSSVPHDSEVLPDAVDAISVDLLTRLRRDYGDDWCTLPLNDYVTEYAAAFSSPLSGTCYPPRSAVIVKRKHELRDMWNNLAARSGDGLQGVEYCYAEQRNGSDEFDYYPSSGFDALPEKTAFVIKPDELSASIEIHSAGSKKEAIDVAHQVCSQLLSRWSKVGRKIGTEVRPRVVIEAAIERSKTLHLGAEFSIEFVSCEGRHYPVGVTQKWTGPGFIESAHLFPAESFPARLRGVLEQAISALMEQLGVRYGVSHWEFIVTPGERIALVEGHLRPAGGRIVELVQHSTGVSPVAALSDALAQRKANFSFVPRRFCGLFWMVPRVPLAEVSEIKIEDTAINGLCQDLFVNQAGIKATPNWSRATDWRRRFAHVIAIGESLESIQTCCRDVAHRVVLHGRTDEGPASTPLMLSIDN